MWIGYGGRICCPLTRAILIGIAKVNGLVRQLATRAAQLHIDNDNGGDKDQKDEHAQQQRVAGQTPRPGAAAVAFAPDARVAACAAAAAAPAVAVDSCG